MEDTQKINGLLFAKMLRAGGANLRAHVSEINDLNVFPIPDGDTGDNMLLTFIGGVSAARNEYTSISDAARSASDGMLLSARGNSGVILSQIFEGLADGLEGVDEADNEALIRAFKEGVRHSYNAVMEPTEGTMLTVFRLACEYVSCGTFDAPAAMLRDFLGEAGRALEKTPDMLPVLKRAGVVDSGGAGLVYIFEGMLGALDGGVTFEDIAPVSVQESEIDVDLFTEDSILEYGYCTELLLRLQRCKTDIDNFELSPLTEYLNGIGDSVVAFKTGSIVKIHIHTATPGEVLAYCQQYGEFLKVKIENMSLQHNNVSLGKVATDAKPDSERKAFGVVAVASGDGIKQLFKERGADVIVDGGQSMNPSAEDFLEAFREVNADTVYVLPNNGNIILAARQAAGLYKDSDIRVIESHTVGDGYAALSMLNFESGDADLIEDELNSAMEGVITAQVSKSVRSTEDVHAGEYIGFVGKDILTAKESRFDAACDTLDKLSAKGFDICILIRGRETDAEEAALIENHIVSNYPGREVYIIDGMQEIYDYIIILE